MPSPSYVTSKASTDLIDHVLSPKETIRNHLFVEAVQIRGNQLGILRGP